MTLAQESNNYKRPGELEFRGIEQLPPTPISPEAVKKLKSWGITETQITEIREFCSSFRYDRCLDKVRRLAQSEVFIRDYQTHEKVDFPFYYDVKGRMDGQCGDIARQFVIQSQFSGLIEDLNANLNLPASQSIVSCIGNGQSKTHFCNEGSNHVWNALGLQGSDGHIWESILVDVAFQKIETTEESGYTTKSLVSAPSIVNRDLEAEVTIGWTKLDETDWYHNSVPSLILGVSDDRKYAYGLKFFRRRYEDGTISLPLTCLTRILADGDSQDFMIHPDNWQLISSVSQQQLNQTEAQEIISILAECATFKYSTNVSAYPREANLGFNINWNK